MLSTVRAPLVTSSRKAARSPFWPSGEGVAVRGRQLNASSSNNMFVAVNGCKVHVKISGDGSNGKPPVLLLHGFPDTGAMWDNQVSALTAAGYKVIVPDLPGFGQSDKPLEVSFYHTNNTSGIMTAMLEQLQVDRFILVGHDWGAAVAWTLAFKMPERVDRLAVLSVGFPGSLFSAAFDQRPRSWYMLFFRLPEAEQLLMANDWALWKGTMEGQTTKEQMAEYITRMGQPGALTAALNVYRANATAEMFGSLTPAPLPGGKKLEMLVLGLWATGDDKYLAEAGMLASAAVVAPGKWQYQRVEASSHWMMIAEPEKTTKALLGFFDKAA